MVENLEKINKILERKKIEEIIRKTGMDLEDPNFTRILLQWDAETKKTKEKSLSPTLNFKFVYKNNLGTEGDFIISL